MFEYEIEVDKPLAEVHAAFNNPDNLPRWLTGLERTELLSGEAGKVGAKTRQVYLERGRTVELVETITAVDPGRSMDGVIEGPGMEATLHVEFEDRGESTVVRFRSGFKAKSLMMWFMLPFFKGGIRKRQQGDLERFGEMMEAGELSG